MLITVIDILSHSDLTTITAKKIRLELEKRTGQSLDGIKKQINGLIEEIFQNVHNDSNVEHNNKQDQTRRIEDLVINHHGIPTKKKTKTPKNTKKRPAEKKQRDMPLLKVLPPLSHIIKTEYCSRTQTVSKMWEYIREHNLQDEKDKRYINCDDYFIQLCDGEKRINTFTLNKYIQKYFEKLSDEEQELRKPPSTETKEPPAKKPKKNPRDMPIVKILPPLSDIIKTEYCSRTQTVSKMWEYIREHGLQNKDDRRLIDCDSKFKELCDGKDQISSFAMNKYTQKCFVKIPEEEQKAIKLRIYGDKQDNEEDDDEEEDGE
ncbi:SWIB-domain-containing protein [Rhizopus microsporus var. microsporus]|uniref:SWIB-domain-containing protein n=1 Tax=Rhizopus microsporus var. microsporus TaxID=86635 RepID=A0A1X0QXF3_RHIZD|nr:SWIB-domain-containing protein [Rhizopus microsporus var. microsporus]